MINQFPSFSKLNIKHKDDVKSITARFEPYSDFDFTSLFCWNVDNTTEISLLNKNLIIKLPDYISGEVVYSVLGDNKIDETVTTLLENFRIISMVPEVVIEHMEHKKSFEITKDRGDFDYIYNLEDLVELPGKAYKVKRNKANHFNRSFGTETQIKQVDLTETADQKLVQKIFAAWAEGRDDKDTQNELRAINKLLQNASALNLLGTLVSIKDEWVGFSINELLPNDYAICHFQKAVLTYDHLDVFISHAVAKELSKFGRTYVNWEQDLDIEGLRALKSSYHPTKFLKKYIVKLAA